MIKDYFAEKFTEFDFDLHYTRNRRLLLHFSMWFLFGIFLFLSYRLAYHLTFWNSFILTLRMILVNASVFYLFFYVFLHLIFRSGKYVALLVMALSVPILVFVWLAETHLISLLYHSLGFEIQNGELKGAIKMSASQTFIKAVSLKRMVSQFIIIISLLSPFFFTKILFEIFRLYNRTLKLQKQKLGVEIQNIQMEKDFLKSQLNPHFLFNTLNNLYGLSVRKDDCAPEFILNLAEIMSYTLYESNAEKVPVEKELDFIRNYFELEKMRHPKETEITLEIVGSQCANALSIAPLLTFTFVENAFKYGLKSEKPFIRHRIVLHDKSVHFILENDVQKHEVNNDYGGIGLENIKKRLQLLYPDQHELKMVQTDDCYKTELSINL